MSKKSIYEIVAENREAILNGTMLSIDPSCSSSKSSPAFAFFNKGELIRSGDIPIDKKADIHTRLREQFAWIENNYGVEVDIIAIELIRKGHTFLRWACVIPFIACFSSTVIELAPQTWHRFVGPDYEKTDTHDAETIGLTLVAMAKGRKKI